jgi:cytoplasmic iron level regulating protein YaaA (DUF328/UPF0246 family)
VTRVVVLLPPSEGKAAGGRGLRTPGAFEALEPSRLTVAKGLRRREFSAVRELKVGPVAAAAAMTDNRRVLEAPVLPALRRYTGVLYDALDYPGRPVPLRRRLDRSVVVVSGLWGLLRGDDPVPAYKLPIGAAVPGAGRLAAWWRPRVTPLLAEHVAGAVVWNLLPGAYGAAVGPLPTARAGWSIRVERESAGRRTVVGHDNKTVKGALAAAVVEHALSGPDALAGWVGPGGYAVAGAADGLLSLVTCM